MTTKNGTTATEDTALAKRTEESTELAPVASGQALEAEIKAAITVALKFPRNEDLSFQKLMKACQRTSFAEEVSYSFPRGGSDVTGPSVYLAREAARVWGNVRHGCDIINDDQHTRTIQAWAWDSETNTKVTAQDSFEKLIYRKKGGWVKPDERDLRELNNRRAAIAKRNCILEILPKDLIEDALEQATNTLKESAERDPDGARKKLLLAFGQLNVTAAMLEQRLGHPLSQCSPAELADLRQVYKSIVDGNSTWSDYGEKTDAKDAKDGPTQVSHVLAAAQEVGWSSQQTMDFVKTKFNKDLTALERGAECEKAIVAIRAAATSEPIPATDTVAKPSPSGESQTMFER